MIGEVEELIEHMAETADVLFMPEDWLEDYLIGRAHVLERQVTRETVRDAIDFWRKDRIAQMGGAR